MVTGPATVYQMPPLKTSKLEAVSVPIVALPFTRDGVN